MNDCNPIPCDCVDGEKGFSGLAGPAGIDGIPGEIGEQGNQGNQGGQGSPGPDGIIGIQGDPGPDANIPITGPTGPDGPEGPQGDQGLPGLDGTNGTDGARGSDAVDAQNPFLDEFPFASVPPIIGTSNINVNQTRIVRNNGLRWYRLSGAWTAITPVVGDIINIYGSIGTSEWHVEVMQNQVIQMNGSQSNVGFSTVIGANGSNPGSPLLQLAPTNYKDCFTFLYIGGEEWLVIKANLAGGLLPTLT